MKTKLYLFLISFIYVFYSCSKEEKIIGKWKLSEININKAISKFKGEQKEFARVVMSKAFENVKGKLSMSFSEDKKYVIQTPLLDGSIKKDEGTWKLSEDNRRLTLNMKQSGKETHILKKITKSIMILEMNQSGFGDMEMTFTKE